MSEYLNSNNSDSVDTSNEDTSDGLITFEELCASDYIKTSDESFTSDHWFDTRTYYQFNCKKTRVEYALIRLEEIRAGLDILIFDAQYEDILNDYFNDLFNDHDYTLEKKLDFTDIMQEYYDNPCIKEITDCLEYLGLDFGFDDKCFVLGYDGFIKRIIMVYNFYNRLSFEQKSN